MSSDVEIHLIAYDEASNVIESVGSNLSGTFTDVEGKTRSLANTTDAATGKMASDYGQVQTASNSLTSASEKTTMGIGQTALSMNNLALSGATLFMSFEKVEKAQIMVDRANLMVQRSTETVELAQKAYNNAVEKYGVDSAEAKDAADKLAIAQEAHNVALERANMASQDYNNTILFSALTVIPSLISIVTAVSNATQIWTGIQAALNVVMDANPIILVCLAIAAITAAIIYAYNACPPFRDAINAIGNALASFFKPILEAITAALTWLWNNVLVPLGNFIADYFIGVWQSLVLAYNIFLAAVLAVDNALKWLWDNILVPLGSFILNVFINMILKPLQAIWDAISAAVTWLWKNVLAPLAAFLTGVLKVAFDVIMVPIRVFMDAINWLIGAASSVLNFFSGLGSALSRLCFMHATPAAEAFNKTLASSMELTNQLTGNVTNLGDSLRELAGVNAEVMAPMGMSIGAGAIPTPMAKAPVTINITAPLVNIEGSADKATAQAAAQLVNQQLQSVIVEATSRGAPAAQKRIRVGPGIMTTGVSP